MFLSLFKSKESKILNGKLKEIVINNNWVSQINKDLNLVISLNKEEYSIDSLYDNTKVSLLKLKDLNMSLIDNICYLKKSNKLSKKLSTQFLKEQIYFDKNNDSFINLILIFLKIIEKLNNEFFKQKSEEEINIDEYHFQRKSKKKNTSLASNHNWCFNDKLYEIINLLKEITKVIKKDPKLFDNIIKKDNNDFDISFNIEAIDNNNIINIESLLNLSQDSIEVDNMGSNKNYNKYYFIISIIIFILILVLFLVYKYWGFD